MASQVAYQHWKWTYKLVKELNIGAIDYLNGLKAVYKSIPVFDNDN
ncbi:hypothetical protein SDC9_186358 [bioreactor metagenome]|uniref:Uncharacterized protein n=1 Tax=bioreactor metagenome TaxID=1076179 RepID=A0A645HTX9_9ZZZZ